MKQKTKQNLLVVRHVIHEFYGKGNLGLYEEIIAKDVQAHCPESWQEIHDTEIPDRKNTKKIDQEYAQAFTIKKVEIADVISGNDKISVRWGSEGLHKGAFFNIPASNRLFSLTGQTTYRFNKDNQIAEVWQSWDMLGLLKQLGYNPLQHSRESVSKAEKILQLAAKLSSRELDCLRYLLETKTAKETAFELGISFRTVEYYFENIKNKLGCSTKKELFALARLFENYQIL